MKIQKINSIKLTNLKYIKNKTLTKPNLTPKIDMFCKSNEVIRALNTKFLNLREDICKELYPLYLAAEETSWNFFINSTDENLNKMTEASDNYSNFFKNEKIYNELKKIKPDVLNKYETKQLKNLLDNFEEELTLGDELKVLRDKENEIAQKYNSYVSTIDGKEVSKAEILKILETETNIELREKAYNAKVLGGDLIAEDLKAFAKIRNDFAKKKGYSNFFEYKLKESYEVDLKELEKLLGDVYNSSAPLIKEIVAKNKKELSETFNIPVNELKQYHYGLLTKNNPEKDVNECFKNKEQIVEISKKAYLGMGYDIDKLIEEGKIVLDLFPRKGKNTHGFCFTIDAERNARILANLTNNANSLDTLNHELGHSIYTLGTSRELCFLDWDSYPAMTEAVAMMMGDLQKRENILADIVPAQTLENFKAKFREDEAKFVSRSLIFINFEKEMYKNPEQDLKKLWKDLQIKYAFANENEDLNNAWATIPH